MITIEAKFTKNEHKVIKAVLDCLEVYLADIEYTGKIIDCDGFIQFEVYLEDIEYNYLFLLRIGVRDNEDTSDGRCNFIYVPSIMIPYKYCNNFFGTTILIILAKTAYEMGLCFFVTCIVNERFFDYLLRLGGVVDQAGDIELFYPAIMARIKTLIRSGDL